MTNGDERHVSPRKQVATDGRTDRRTDGPTDVPLLRSGADGASRDQADDERRAAKRAAVAAYIRAANEALIPTDRTARGMIAQQTGKLLDQDWPLETILRAIDRFARKRRMAGHLAQWVRENAMDEREGEHADRMKSDRMTAKSSMHRLGDALRKAGL